VSERKIAISDPSGTIRMHILGQATDAEGRFPSKKPLYDLVLFFTVFGTIWIGCVVLVWKLEWLPEAMRPWFRTAIWLTAGAAWIWWQKLNRPFAWLGLAPVTRRHMVMALSALLVILVWNLARVWVIDPPQGRLATLLLSGYAWTLTGVVVEELMFRGIVQTRLTEHVSASVAIALAAFLFLVIHFPGWLILSIPVNPSIVVSVLLIGVVCGWLRHWSGSLWPAITAHWANNLGALF
jgi:membrane protease YdiL (CAAX protease family)